jgi:hypothetical protein
VLTSLNGRSAETAGRARDAGMVAASDEEIAVSDYILSTCRPATRWRSPNASCRR